MNLQQNHGKVMSGSVNINLEHNARRDQIARIARATVTEATTGDRVTTYSDQEISHFKNRALWRNWLGKFNFLPVLE
jgi:hypothetical protein